MGEDSQASQLISNLLGGPKDPMWRNSAENTTTLSTRTLGDTPLSIDRSAESSINGSAPRYHYHGLAATQTQTQTDDIDINEHSHSQKENAPLHNEASPQRAGNPLVPRSLSLPSPPKSPSRSPPTHNAHSFHANADAQQETQRSLDDDGPPPSLPRTPPTKAAKSVAFISPHASSPSRINSGLARRRTVPSPRRSRSRSPPRSQDSFAAQAPQDEARRFIAESKVFNEPIAETQDDTPSDRFLRQVAAVRSTMSSRPPSPSKRANPPSSPHQSQSQSQSDGLQSPPEPDDMEMFQAAQTVDAPLDDAEVSRLESAVHVISLPPTPASRGPSSTSSSQPRPSQFFGSDSSQHDDLECAATQPLSDTEQTQPLTQQVMGPPTTATAAGDPTASSITGLDRHNTTLEDEPEPADGSARNTTYSTDAYNLTEGTNLPGPSTAGATTTTATNYQRRSLVSLFAGEDVQKANRYVRPPESDRERNLERLRAMNAAAAREEASPDHEQSANVQDRPTRNLERSPVPAAVPSLRPARPSPGLQREIGNQRGPPIRTRNLELSRGLNSPATAGGSSLASRPIERSAGKWAKLEERLEQADPNRNLERLRAINLANAALEAAMLGDGSAHPTQEETQIVDESTQLEEEHPQPVHGHLPRARTTYNTVPSSTAPLRRASPRAPSPVLEPTQIDEEPAPPPLKTAVPSTERVRHRDEPEETIPDSEPPRVDDRHATPPPSPKPAQRRLASVNAKSRDKQRAEELDEPDIIPDSWGGEGPSAAMTDDSDEELPLVITAARMAPEQVGSLLPSWKADS
jgi:hypothetical protein